MSQPHAQTVKDVMDPARAEACAAVLDRPAPTDTLPPFWHHLHFWDVQSGTRLGRDGHVARGVGMIPDLGLPRRMWAGGHVEFMSPLSFGQVATRRTTLRDIHRKTGRSGPLALVTLVHEIGQGDILRLRERQTLVYREDPSPDALELIVPPAPEADVEETRIFDALTLMRYSALTMNAHRIHWDESYATGVEGHAGLVVHGPLLVEGLIDLATRYVGPLATIDYRATSPAIANETLTFCLRHGGPTSLATAFVRGADGGLRMTAEVRPA
ncbi:acyl dehydratase [Jannaschia sp. 2305UL9-9]|uniref:acyl dehydratase n=1 Tax=Jannaschia sp. 2305UL9-9 TaxID=3121638 RepID=UPI003526ED8B